MPIIWRFPTASETHVGIEIVHPLAINLVMLANVNKILLITPQISGTEGIRLDSVSY